MKVKLTPDQERRSKWPVRVYRLGEEPADNLLETTTAEERLAMVWEITKDVWALSGREMPTYTRDQMPVRISRLEDQV